MEYDDEDDGEIKMIVMVSMLGGAVLGMVIGTVISVPPSLTELAIGGAIGMVTGGIVFPCAIELCRRRYCQPVKMNNTETKLPPAPPQTVTITTHPQMELQATHSSPSESDSLIKAPLPNTPTTAKMSA